MKTLRSILASMLIIAMLSTGFGATTKSSSQTQSSKGASEKVAYKKYTHKALKMTLSYPDTWTVVDQEFVDDIKKQVNEIGRDADIDFMMDQYDNMIFLFVSIDSASGFASNISILRTAPDSITQKDLKNQKNLSDFSTSTLNDFKAIYPDAKLANKISNKTFGKNTYISLSMKYTYQGFKLKTHQLLTVINKYDYIFTLTATDEEFDKLNKLFETVVSKTVYLK